MNADKNILRSAIKSGIKEALSVFDKKNQGDTLSDVYIRIDEDNSKICIFDDMENLLTEKNIEVWTEDESSDESLLEKVFVKTAKSALQELNKEGAFNKEFLFKPFSINLVDEHFIISEELLFLDDDNLKLDSEALINLDKELDDFLQNLMKDVD